MGVLLLALGGFLAGGTISLWRMAGEAGVDATPSRTRQLRGFAVALALCCALAVAAGILRLK